MIRTELDTALWTAACRAHETARPDALFSDPLADHLAGLRGRSLLAAAEKIAPAAASNAVRTRVFDDIIIKLVESGIDTVINLGAGLDTRPYRLKLPPSLRWFEIDRPEVVMYKESRLAGAEPGCVVERIKMDLKNAAGRLLIRRRLGPASRRALVITEGALLYWTPEEAAQLIEAFGQERAFHYWLTDLASPVLVEQLGQLWSPFFGASFTFRFAPREGAGFFESRGYRVVERRSTWADLVRFNRLPPGSPLPTLDAGGEPEVPPALRDLASTLLLERGTPGVG